MIINNYVYFRKGETYMANMPIKEGSSSQGGYRPITILSCDKNNDHSSLVHIATLTGQNGKNLYNPANVLVNPDFLPKASVVQCNQTEKIDQDELIDYIDWTKGCIGKMSEEDLCKIDLGIMAHFGIGASSVKFYVNKNRQFSYA